MFEQQRKNLEIIKKLNLRSPHVWLATWFGSGLMYPGPGTWGTIAGIPFAIIFFLIGGKPLILAAIVVFYIIGIIVSNKIEQETKEHDLSIIVIDEVVGIWVALLATDMTPIHIIIAFIIFRILDIFKPWPICWVEKKLPGGRGVMADDLLAGFFAALITGGLIHVFNI